MKVYSVHGRFQPLHLGHLDDYILPVANRSDLLIVGITNPDPHLTLDDDTNLARTVPFNNPLSYYERYNLIFDVLVDSGLSCENFRIVPFPINFPQLIHGYIPEISTQYLTIFDSWGEKKVKLLKQNGLKTQVLFRKSMSEKLISSTLVRETILSGSSWKQLVPPKCSDHLEELKFRSRLIQLKNQSN